MRKGKQLHTMVRKPRGARSRTSGPAPDGLLTNESFIQGCRNALDLECPKDVFRYVFLRLPRKVVVYPTENYYYFEFPVNGQIVRGSVTLGIRQRDKGEIGFGYWVRQNQLIGPARNPAGVRLSFCSKDGVVVKKTGKLRYAVTFEEHTVRFLLHDAGNHPPCKAKLRADEVYVGPCFDESGLQFFLIFNKTKNCFHWVLNEDVTVCDKMVPVSQDVVMGERTDYGFYLDRSHHRKILIGVEGLNALENNWYDGPFDQLPDNYIHAGQVEIKKYLEAAFPHLRSEIDQYGYLLRQPEQRAAITPYLHYFVPEDLVKLVNHCRSVSQSESDFFACITRPQHTMPKQLAEEFFVDPDASQSRSKTDK